MRKVLVTGAAGFIGFYVSRSFLDKGFEVLGIDNLNDYYDVGLKRARLSALEGHGNFRFLLMDISDRGGMARLFEGERFDVVVNMAAQAGVRYSLLNPHAYVDSNLAGFVNVLEGCRRGEAAHLVFASSSSVYGANARSPFSVHHRADHPLSLYGATKRANELMAHAYASLYGLPVTGLRFFTVYGPWGRPDMAYFLFTKAILEGRPIDVYNHGKMKRDFTYIDDVTEAVVLIAQRPPGPDPRWDPAEPDAASSRAPYRLHNVGNSRPVELGRFIEALEECLGLRAVKNFLPMQAGDVLETCADVDDLAEAVGFRPETPLEEGLRRFVDWYRGYYRA